MTIKTLELSKVIKLSFPEQSAPGKYLLIIQRGGGSPFGGGGPTAAFAVDELNMEMDNSGKAVAWIATLAGENRAAFPVGTQYLLLSRDLVTVVSVIDAEREKMEESKQLESLYKKLESPQDLITEEAESPSTGRNTYL